jgi:hypothetical protein
MLVAGIALASGCSTKTALRDKPPPDPLLISKKPVEGNAHLSESRPPTDEDYSPPVRPAYADRPVSIRGVRPAGGER